MKYRVPFLFIHFFFLYKSAWKKNDATWKLTVMSIMIQVAAQYITVQFNAIANNLLSKRRKSILSRLC